MSAPEAKATAPQHTLTIEYLDAQGQLQRTEQIQGAHFTLRVQADALAVVSLEAAVQEANNSRTDHMLSPALPTKNWQRITPRVWAMILFGIFAVLSALEFWIEYNPDSTTQNYVTVALGVTAVIALWAAFWALLGKIFTKHAYFWQHLCIVLGVGIVLSLLMASMHFLSFSLSWRVLGQINYLTMLTLLGLMAWMHLRLIVPKARDHSLRLSMLSFTLLSVALLMWTNHRRQDTVLDTLHSPHLYRPWLQLSTPQSSQAFFEQSKSLEATLKAKAGVTEPGEDNTGSQED